MEVDAASAAAAASASHHAAAQAGFTTERLDPTKLYQAEQQRWWEDRAEAHKRPPPTPGSSAIATLGMPGQRDHGPMDFPAASTTPPTTR